MSVTINPLSDRLLVELIDKEKTLAGGLLLPETAKERSQQGRVLAIGKGRRGRDGKRIPMCVKVGDRILFAKYAGLEINLDSKKRLIIDESDILGIV